MMPGWKKRDRTWEESSHESDYAEDRAYADEESYDWSATYEEEDGAEEEIQENALKDYDEYVMGVRERLMYLLFAGAVVFGVGMIFYHNVVLAGILALALAFRYPEIRRKQIIRRQKEELTIQFKDLLYALSAAMGAGRSLENAFQRALRDLEIMYDKDAPIMRETAHIVHRIRLNDTVVDALDDLAARAHIEDIQSFADVIRVCNGVGGDLVEVTRSTSQMISDKIETKSEIETIITGKKYESRIMCLLPIVMVALLGMSAPDFMAPVFDWRGVIGPVVMTVAIVVFVGAYLLGERITDIEV